MDVNRLLLSKRIITGKTCKSIFRDGFAKTNERLLRSSVPIGNVARRRSFRLVYDSSLIGFRPDRVRRTGWRSGPSPTLNLDISRESTVCSHASVLPP